METLNTDFVSPPQGSMKHIIRVIVLLLCCLHVSGQDITLVGQVRDAFLKKALVARISVYETDSTTCILDSVPVERIDDANDRIMAALYNVPVRPVKHDYLIKAELPGYDVAWQKVSVTILRKRKCGYLLSKVTLRSLRILMTGTPTSVVCSEGTDTG